MKVAYMNFTGGEINGNLSSRYDLAKFKTSCRYLENFIPELHGPLRRRMGSHFLEDLGAFSILLPFEFSSDPRQNYVLLVQEGKLRLAQRHGFVRLPGGGPLELAAPYRLDDLYDISYAQSGDVLYLAHYRHPLHKLSRFGHSDWRLAEVPFTVSIAAPAALQVNFSGSGSFCLRYKVAAVNEKGEVSAAVLGQNNAAKHPNDWVVGDCAELSWPAVATAEQYNIYREEAGSFGLIGVCDGRTTRFRDDKYAANLKDTPSIPYNPFQNGNHPGVVCFHQQRLILGATALQPQTWFASRTGSYEDFSKSRPVKDDDALEFTLASGRIDMIQWAAAFGDLLIGTAGSEYKAVGANHGAITPSSLSMREQSYWGSIKLRPLIIGNSVLHVQRQGSRVRDLTYSLERDGYAGNDLSVLASHLFERRGIRQWAYQQSPGSLIYCVRDDGLILVLVYMKEHDIWGWSRISTQGAYRSVACTAGSSEDDLYTVVERTVEGRTVWHLERTAPCWHGGLGIEQAFYVDSGLSYARPGGPVSAVRGLDHLEGCVVSVLADGAVLEPMTVRQGSIHLPHAAEHIHVGLPYRSLLCPQTPEAEMPESGSSLARVRGYGKSFLRLLDSVGGQYGPSLESLCQLPFRPDAYGQPVKPFSGDLAFVPGGGFDGEGVLWLAQDQPLPFTLAALVLDVDLEG